MTESIIYAVYRTKATQTEAFLNAWRGAMPLWRMIHERYLHQPLPMDISEKDALLWKLVHKSYGMPDSLRIAHAFTFTGAIITRKHIARGIVGLLETHDLLKSATGEDFHWRGYAEAIRGARLDPRALGFGLCATTICDPWRSHGKYRNPDGADPWDLFEEIIDAKEYGA